MSKVCTVEGTSICDFHTKPEPSRMEGRVVVEQETSRDIGGMLRASQRNLQSRNKNKWGVGVLNRYK